MLFRPLPSIWTRRKNHQKRAHKPQRSKIAVSQQNNNTLALTTKPSQNLLLPNNLKKVITLWQSQMSLKKKFLLTTKHNKSLYRISTILKSNLRKILSLLRQALNPIQSSLNKSKKLRGLTHARSSVRTKPTQRSRSALPHPHHFYLTTTAQSKIHSACLVVRSMVWVALVSIAPNAQCIRIRTLRHIALCAASLSASVAYWLISIRDTIWSL